MGYREHKRSLRQKMQDLMSTSKGQTIMNYAYNWGASIVIMGTLFKLVHFPGANIMLCFGMGTEVLIFFISAFDLSGVKKQSIPEVQSNGTGTMPMGDNLSEEMMNAIAARNVANANANALSAGGSSMQTSVFPFAASPAQPTEQPFIQPIGQPFVQPTGQPFVQPFVQSAPQPINPEMEKATTEYLEQLKAMTEMLARCTGQAQSVSQDAEQMSTLSKNLAGINAIYEMQLRSVSTQIGTIDQVHEQTRRMARQIEELNEVYARMLHAMTSSNK